MKHAEAVRQAGKAGWRSVLLGARKSAARATGTDAHHIEVAVTLARRAAAADAAAAELQRVGGLGGVPKAFKRAPRAARALRQSGHGRPHARRQRQWQSVHVGSLVGGPYFWLHSQPRVSRDES